MVQEESHYGGQLGDREEVLSIHELFFLHLDVKPEADPVRYRINMGDAVVCSRDSAGSLER